jgi:hypothetical protein
MDEPLKENLKGWYARLRAAVDAELAEKDRVIAEKDKEIAALRKALEDARLWHSLGGVNDR